MLPLAGVPLGPEILILVLLGLFALPFVLAIWVYQDATERGNDSAAIWAVLVGGLGFLTFFGGILAFVIYLLDRE
ncbi:hypothetical protein GCM10028857_23940 [Salinarchaeum chitinilyticum]